MKKQKKKKTRRRREEEEKRRRREEEKKRRRDEEEEGEEEEPSVIQHVQRMRRIILLSVAYMALQNFFTSSHTGHNFFLKLIKHKMRVTVFSTTFV